MGLCADLGNYPKHKRGPKRPPPQRLNAQFHHVSTWKLREERQQKKNQRSLAMAIT